MINIKIATDFTKTPGARYKSDGRDSGELFYESMLKPKFIEAKKNAVELYVDIDGTEGYATSFLEEAFGRLGEEFGPADVLFRLKLKSIEEPDWIEEINTYINEGPQRKQPK